MSDQPNPPAPDAQGDSRGQGAESQSGPLWQPAVWGEDLGQTSAQATRPQRQGADPRQIVRVLGTGLVALAALLIVSLLTPETASTSSNASERSIIWADDEANQSRTSGAPQQNVVNGWTTNEFLGLISEQLDDAAIVDHRPAALLTLAIVQVGLLTLTMPSSRPVFSPREADPVG